MNAILDFLGKAVSRSGLSAALVGFLAAVSLSELSHAAEPENSVSGSVSIGASEHVALESTVASLEISADAGVDGDGSLTFDENGVTAQLEVLAGLAAEVEVQTEELSVGGEDVSASAQLRAQAEAVLGVQAAAEAHIDANGIYIGGEASAGAFVSAEVALDFGVNFFGVAADANVLLKGHAGVLAEGQAEVAIGFDGKVRIRAGLGASFGLGASAQVSVALDASELVERLGLNDLRELVAWLERFMRDPREFLEDLATEFVQDLLDRGIDAVSDTLDQVLDDLEDAIDIIDSEPPPPDSLAAGCPVPSACDVVEVYADAAENSYQTNSGGLTQSVVSLTQSGESECPEWADVMSARIGPQGFYAEVTYIAERNEFILAFRGTEGISDLGDWIANFENVLAGSSEQLQAAAEYAVLVYEAVSNCASSATLTITGHSLGGQLAQRAAYAVSEQLDDTTSVSTITFNPSALANFPGRDNDRLASLCINNFVHEYDILHNLANPASNFFGALTILGFDLIPGSTWAGATTVLGNTNEDLEQLASSSFRGSIEAGFEAHGLGSEARPTPLFEALQLACENEQLIGGGGVGGGGGGGSGPNQGGNGSNNPPTIGDGPTDLPSVDPVSGLRLPPAIPLSSEDEEASGGTGIRILQPGNAGARGVYNRRNQRYGN